MLFCITKGMAFSAQKVKRSKDPPKTPRRTADQLPLARLIGDELHATWPKLRRKPGIENFSTTKVSEIVVT
jgi:hypothetical protein